MSESTSPMRNVPKGDSRMPTRSAPTASMTALVTCACVRAGCAWRAWRAWRACTRALERGCERCAQRMRVRRCRASCTFARTQPACVDSKQNGSTPCQTPRTGSPRAESTATAAATTPTTSRGAFGRSVSAVGRSTRASLRRASACACAGGEGRGCGDRDRTRFGVRGHGSGGV